jgi:hypothetical protein
MAWLTERADVRQQITSALTGLASNAARKKAPEFQAALIDSVIDDGDITPAQFEEAFAPEDLVVFGPVDAYWREFRAQMPWGDSAPVHQELIAWLTEALLRDRCTLELVGPNVSRTPILTAWDVRTAINGRVWHSHMPIEVRVTVDEARLQLEKSSPKEPFHAQHDLAIAMPSVIATSIPLVELVDVFLLAERTMGFATTPVIHVEVPEGAEGAMDANDAAAKQASTQPFATVTATVAAPASKKGKRSTLMTFPTAPPGAPSEDVDVAIDDAQGAEPKSERAGARSRRVAVSEAPPTEASPGTSDALDAAKSEPN